MVRLYRQNYSAIAERSNPGRSNSEIESLRQEIYNLPVVSYEDLQRLQNRNEYWCSECGARITDVSQKQCGRCGSDTGVKRRFDKCEPQYKQNSEHWR